MAAAFVEWAEMEPPAEQRDRQRKILHNALLESSLLFIRKSAEFFQPEEGPFPDTLYAHQYIRGWGSWIVPKCFVHEFHKRVAYISVSGVRYGKWEWPIEAWTLCALDEWIRFYRELPQSPVFEDRAPVDLLNEQRKRLELLAATCEQKLLGRNFF